MPYFTGQKREERFHIKWYQQNGPSSRSHLYSYSHHALCVPSLDTCSKHLAHPYAESNKPARPPPLILLAPNLKPPPKHQPQSSHSPPHFLHQDPNNSSNCHSPSSSSRHSHSYYRPSSSHHSHSYATPRSSRAPYSSSPLRARGRGRRAGDAGGLWLRGGGSQASMLLLCLGVWGGRLDVRM